MTKFTDKLTIEEQMDLHHEGMNIAVAKTNDGRSCILCDRELPVRPIKIGYFTADGTVRLIYDDENIYGKSLSYPLQYDIVQLWQKQKRTYFAYILDGEVSNILELPVVFID
ncbi:MAG: hypothetical protein EA357_03505 [Micavibrio sp.]|nr:MAG: hypothetical protein EA357_03505 [Micavibrio sp.]